MVKGINGKETPYKQDDFRELLNHHINVCFPIINKSWTTGFYHYFDMFAGPGILDNGIKGSPVIFQETIAQYLLDYQADIVEQDKAIFEQLQLHKKSSQVRLYLSDSKNIYRNFLITKNSKQYGLLYLDPDMSEDGFDLSFEIAEKFSIYYPRLDILFYISANNIKRIRSAKGTQTLIQRLAPIKKSDWIIRTLRDKFQYTFLIGTNYPKPFCWKKRGFYDVKSKEGQAILEKANYTIDEINRGLQPFLF